MRGHSDECQNFSLVSEEDVPDAPNLCPRNFDAAWQCLEFPNPSPQDLVGVYDRGVDQLVAHNSVRLWTHFIPVLFDNRSWCRVALWPRASRDWACKS